MWRKIKEGLLSGWLNNRVFTFHASSSPIEMTREKELKRVSPADLGRKESLGDSQQMGPD